MDTFEEKMRKMADDAKGEVDKRYILTDLKVIRENMAARNEHLEVIDTIIKGMTVSHECKSEYCINKWPEFRKCPVDLSVPMGSIPIHLRNMYKMSSLQYDTQKSFEELKNAYPFYPDESIKFIGDNLTRPILNFLNVDLSNGSLVDELAAVLVYKYVYQLLEALNFYRGLTNSGGSRAGNIEATRELMHHSNMLMLKDISGVVSFIGPASGTQLSALVTHLPRNIYALQDMPFYSFG